MTRAGQPPTRSAAFALALGLTSLAGAGEARAQTPAPAPAPAAPDPAAAAAADAELRRMAEAQAKGEPGSGEVVEIYDARPKPPIERGTEVRLTYPELVQRGATDLASALRLLPDVTVRDAGRGGFNVDIRGGRKGAVIVLVDGMQVTDPFYGTFDVSTIPITDIVQIRISTNPASPLDGPGGPGGVIEVLTRDAIGPQLVIARLTGDSLPTFGMTGMAKVALAKHLALRISMSGEAGSHDFELDGTTSKLDEGRHTATGSTRLEYRRGKRRVVADGFLDSRHYLSPPADSDKGDLVMIDRELSARASVKADDEIGPLQLQGQAYAHYLARRSHHFADIHLEAPTSEDLYAMRTGGAVVAARSLGLRGRWVSSVSASRESAHVTSHTGQLSEGDATIIEAASGLAYDTTRWKLDGAVGVAVPIGLGASPWPETKLVATYRPRKGTELVATGGYKGRVPSLRERFAPDTGDPALAPEKAWHGEVRAISRLGEWLRAEVAPFYRRTTGIIRLVPAPTAEDPKAMKSGNLDLVTFLGVDAQARVKPHRMVELGGSYNYIRARGTGADGVSATDPLDRLPRHRADGWVQISPDRRISVLGRVKYFGESLDKTTDIAGYATVEATVTAPLTKQYLGVLRIDDLTDVRPETRKGYHSPGRVISLVVQGSWE
jgi:outer membrane receptor protein involved in Fe transport